MAEAARRLWTVGEFLTYEGEGDRRYELIRGEIVAMAPPTRVHGALVVRLAAALRAQLRAPCEAVAEAGIVPPDRADTYYQADLAVTCTPAETGEIYLRQPSLIVEVLSPSTAITDRVHKLPDYRSIASVAHILLVSSSERRIECWRRGGDIWTVRDLAADAIIVFEDLGCRMALAELYEGLLDAPEGARSG